MTTYPAEYPQPTWDYGFGTTAHNRRRVFDSGWARQRRRWQGFSAVAQLTFQMSTAEFDDWANWIDKLGAETFQIELDVYGGTPRVVNVRVAGPFAWQYAPDDTIVARLPVRSLGG